MTARARPAMTGRMRTGLDRLLSNDAGPLLAELRGAKVALLAHPASLTARMRHASDELAAAGLSFGVLFGPEHGYGGEAQDMVSVGNARSGAGTRIVSLYGERLEDLAPKREDLDGLDALVIDLQDVGSRYYTYVWTAVLAARVAAAEAGVKVVVLDRPNPLGRSVVEGRVQSARFCSFVGLEPIPVRHGLTLGEIVAWRAAAEGYLDRVRVVASRDLAEDAHAPAWGRPFVMPSPNMPTYDTALVYPGGCLLEGTNLSDGRGTTRPFEITGAPFIDGSRLASDLEALGLDGFVARALSFQPTFHKHAGELCGGVQIHVVDRARFRPYATYVALVALARRQAPDRFRFRTERYEFVDDIPAFDLLTGSAEARERISAGDDPRAIAEDISRVGDAEREVRRAAREAFARVAL